MNLVMQSTGGGLPPAVIFGAGRDRVVGIERHPRSRRKKGVIFDLDDTLYPRQRFVQSGFAAVARHLASTYGVSGDIAFATLSRCQAREQQSQAFQVLCERFGLDQAIVPTLVDVFRSHRPNIFLGHGVREALRSLRTGGWRLAVLTNGLPSVQTKKVEALGLADLVDHVLYAEHYAPSGKPAREVFSEAVARLGVPTDRIVCVGDDPERDVAGARACGIATIRLARPGVTVRPDREADIVIAGVDEVPYAASSLIEGVTRHVA